MIRLFQNTLHPNAAYLDTASLDTADDLTTLEVPDGYVRVLLTVDQGADLDLTDWAEVQRTAVFLLDAADCHCPTARAIGAPEMNDWLEAHWAYYRDANSANPAERPMNLRRVFGQSIEDGTAAFIGSGFASLRGMRAGVAEAGWISGTPAEVAEAIDWCLTQAHRIGATQVEFTAQDTDPFLFAALKKRAAPTQIDITYEKTAP